MTFHSVDISYSVILGVVYTIMVYVCNANPGVSMYKLKLKGAKNQSDDWY